MNLKNGSHKQKSMEALMFHGIDNATTFGSWNVPPYVDGLTLPFGIHSFRGMTCIGWMPSPIHTS
jgi:hypothetical protein